jgi:predicted metal-dependent hydrolase
MDIADDPRFLAGVELLRTHDYFDASEVFEDLFFEAVRDEVPFARVFLQVAVGAHHLERGQRQAAIDRLAEGLIAIKQVVDDRGYDLARLRADVQALIACVRAGERFTWPEVFRRADGP